MKKTLWVLVVLAIAMQVAFAQRGRVVTIYFHNGSVVKGEISKLSNEERFKVQTPNGSVFLFTSHEVRDILYEDGTRPGGGNMQYRPQTQQPNQIRQQQTYPPVSQPNQGNQPYQLQQQPQQQPQRQQSTEMQQQNNQVVTEQEDEYLIEDEEFYDEDSDFILEDTETETPAKPRSKSKTPPAAPTVSNSDFVPGYHGFVDFGYTIGMGDSAHAFNRMELTITQGYQFSPSLFVGLGTGIHLYSDSVPLRKIVDKKPVVSSLSYVFPIFVDLRYNFSDGKIKPYAALKAGYGIGLSKTFSETVNSETGQRSRKTEYKAETLGFYVAPTVGVKFMLGRSLAFNLGAGYSVQLYNDVTLKPGTTNTSIKKTDMMGGVTLKAGLEF
jgi:hypothetical protein